MSYGARITKSNYVIFQGKKCVLCRNWNSVNTRCTVHIIFFITAKMRELHGRCCTIYHIHYQTILQTEREKFVSKASGNHLPVKKQIHKRTNNIKDFKFPLQLI